MQWWQEESTLTLATHAGQDSWLLDGSDRAASEEVLPSCGFDFEDVVVRTLLGAPTVPHSAKVPSRPTVTHLISPVGADNACDAFMGHLATQLKC